MIEAIKGIGEHVLNKEEKHLNTLLNMENQVMEYKKRDFIYSNGLVNAFMYLQADENADDINSYTINWNDREYL